MTVYEAIEQMRILSRNGKPFSFAFASLNRDTHKSEGLVYVDKAILRPAALEESIKYADFKLFYKDLISGENRVCWQPLIMIFNDERVMLQ